MKPDLISAAARSNKVCWPSTFKAQARRVETGGSVPTRFIVEILTEHFGSWIGGLTIDANPAWRIDANENTLEDDI